jgi:hypothetical protein
MVTRDQIDQFYKDVDLLGLKFPVADIERATKESKGNISKYLSKGSDPSENFLKKFYKSFGPVLEEKKKSGQVVLTGEIERFIKEAIIEIIKLNARVDVLSITLAEVTGKVDNKTTALVDSELIRAANHRNKAILEEWKKKFPGLLEV